MTARGYKRLYEDCRILKDEFAECWSTLIDETVHYQTEHQISFIVLWKLLIYSTTLVPKATYLNFGKLKNMRNRTGLSNLKDKIKSIPCHQVTINDH